MAIRRQSKTPVLCILLHELTIWIAGIRLQCYVAMNCRYQSGNPDTLAVEQGSMLSNGQRLLILLSEAPSQPIDSPRLSP